jgi:hypothetical protein
MPDVRARTRLLAITLDPAHDTPAVLREYGQAVLRGPTPFDRVSLLTGQPDDIRRLAASLGVSMAGTGVITHTNATVVVGLDGRVARAFGTNDWQPAEIAALLSTLVRTDNSQEIRRSGEQEQVLQEESERSDGKSNSLSPVLLISCEALPTAAARTIATAVPLTDDWRDYDDCEAA